MKSGSNATVWYHYTRPLLLTALLLPITPALALALISFTGSFAECTLSMPESCLIAGLDINYLYGEAVALLHAAANASTGQALLFYLIVIGVLAQTTISGFRGRVVRTFSTILGVGVTPFILGASRAMAASADTCGEKTAALHLCRDLGVLESIAFYGNAFAIWLATTAVPLAVMCTALLVLTMAYRALVARLARALASAKLTLAAPGRLFPR